MRTLKLGGSDVGVVGQGTWQLEQFRAPDVVAALQRGLDLGCNHIDVAEMWGGGEVERLVGLAIHGRRDKAFVQWKVRPHLSGAGLAGALEDSLSRLGTDHVDLCVLHWPDEGPVEAFVAAAEKLRDAGKVRAWGVGRFDKARLEKLLRMAPPGRVACNQVEYHVRQRRADRDLLGFCREQNLPVVAYSPLGSGNFPQGPGPGSALLQKLGKRHGASPQRVALAFLLRHPHVLVVPRAVTLRHVADNAAAAELVLSAAEVAELEGTFTSG